MRSLRQIWAVSVLSLGNLPLRFGNASVIVVGIAGVIVVLISVLAMASGFLRTVEGAGRADRAIVLAEGGFIGEASSVLSRETVATVLDTPGIKMDANGKALGSAEGLLIVPVKTREGDTLVNVTLRGIAPEALRVRPEIRLTQGRMFAPGRREIVAGRMAQARFGGLQIGQQVVFRNNDWTVVGAFETSDDTALESELLADVETMLSANGRNQFQSVTVQLESAAAFDDFAKSLAEDPRISVRARTEPEHFARRAEGLSAMLRFIAYGIGGIMALGAVFAALNTMYTAVAARRTEIATLRAIGFGGLAVVTSVLGEALLLALVGAVIGVSLAWVLFQGTAINMMAGGNTQIVYTMQVTPNLVVTGIVWAFAIALIGGLVPAIRAVRAPIAGALREG